MAMADWSDKALSWLIPKANPKTNAYGCSKAKPKNQSVQRGTKFGSPEGPGPHPGRAQVKQAQGWSEENLGLAQVEAWADLGQVLSWPGQALGWLELEPGPWPRP